MVITMLLLALLAWPTMGPGGAKPPPTPSCCDMAVCCCADDNTCLCERPEPADEPAPSPGTPSPRPLDVAKVMGMGGVRIVMANATGWLAVRPARPSPSRSAGVELLARIGVRVV